ncbi:cytochrome c biogenesis protein CcsA [candidate division KSB1 bacterium]|nr:cytochrome c biogenesis protein CcsA [candidate division KSB1 bacterium]
MIQFAQFTLWAELLLVLISTIGYFIACYINTVREVRIIARASYYGFVVFSFLASAALMIFLLTHNFRIEYVAAYSSRSLELHYLISSFWAGQEGSFLLWLLLAGILGIILMFKAKDMEPQVMFAYNLSNLFLAILLIKQSPFRLLPDMPIDGNGLNMLLQDPWMVIHPPLVFLGYAAFTIPFAFALAGFWRRQYDRWVTLALPWTVFAFVILGAGIIIGGYWAYKVLGWGGYWGWDPVENASLLPWLTGTALMHGLLLQQTKGHFKKTNFFLAAISFILIIYSTFLTRSGILADFSVHSFVDLGITGWLVFFIIGFSLISILVFIFRMQDIPRSGKPMAFTLFNRESVIAGSIIILLIFTLIIGVGTSFPIISKLFSKGAKVPNSYYVNWDLPFAILMLLLISYGPLLAWGKNKLSRLFPGIIFGASAGVLCIILSIAYGFKGWGAIFILLAGGAAAGTNLWLILKLMPKRFTISGAAVTHLGVGLMFIGFITSSVYDSSQRLALKKGETKPALGAELTFIDAEYLEKDHGSYLFLPILVTCDGDSFIARPDMYIENKPGSRSNRFSHPHIHRRLVADLYISPEGFDPGEADSMQTAKLTITKGSTIPYKGYHFTFHAFDMAPPESKMSGAGHSMRIGADLSISFEENPPVKLKPIFDVSSPESREATVELPGPPGRFITLKKIDASSKSIVLSYTAPHEEHASEAPPTPIAFVEVSKKPGMSLLWLAIVLILAGGIISIFRKAPAGNQPEKK